MALPLLEDDKRLAIRGALVLIHGVKFPGGNTIHSKFCVLMEDYVRSKHEVVVAFCTSNIDYHYRDTTFMIPGGTFDDLPEDTLVQLENYEFISRGKLFSNRCYYVGTLPSELVKEMDDALVNLRTDESTWLRMCG